MSIVINNFAISNDGSEIEVHAETDAGYVINGAKFWTDDTFQDAATAVDLSSLLASTSNEELFTITAAAAGVSNFFDGIFFIQFSQLIPSPAASGCDDCNTPLGVAAKLVAAKICLLEKVLALDVCFDGCQGGCSCIDTCDVITLDNYIDAMSIAIQYGFYTEAIELLNSIRKLCTTCSECINLDNFTSNTGLSYYTLNGTIVLQ